MCIAVLEITVGHWPFSKQILVLTNPTIYWFVWPYYLPKARCSGAVSFTNIGSLNCFYLHTTQKWPTIFVNGQSNFVLLGHMTSQFQIVISSTGIAGLHHL